MKDPFEIREIPFRENKTIIKKLTLDNLKRHFPSTTRAERPAQALTSLDEAPETRHLAAFSPDGELIGTVRLQPLESREGRRAYGIDGLPDWIHFAEVAGLAVADSFRDTPVPVELVSEAYKRARSLGSHVIVLHTLPSLVMMYEAFGFFRYGPGFQHADHGFVVPMMMNLHDVAYMRLVGSPLTRLAQRYFNPDRHGLVLLGHFKDIVAETRPPRRRSSGAQPAARATSPAPEARPEKETLDVGPVIELVGGDARQELPSGTRLTAPDAPTPYFYVVLGGTLGVQLDGENVPVMYLREGDVVAETAFAAEGQQLTIVTLSECQVLRLAPDDLERVVAADPAYGGRLMIQLFVGLADRFSRHLQQWKRNQKPGPMTVRWRRELTEQLKEPTAAKDKRPRGVAAGAIPIPDLATLKAREAGSDPLRGG
ncbi:MAG: GNAT family N-acetyltransferase [Myxococcales bacterium]|nr:GNAT family N-acetyltransferase [Myxococcales bacterium]MCB9737027.1 GNAT family N-acetyltransferase [Deltaproteobacteria bacterium]